MEAAQENMITEVVKALKAQGAAGSHEEELDQTDKEYAARLQREEQKIKDAHGRGHGAGRGGDAFGRGRGRGRGDGAAGETIDTDTFLLHCNDNFQ
jgi:hypothetical protein